MLPPPIVLTLSLALSALALGVALLVLIRAMRLKSGLVPQSRLLHSLGYSVDQLLTRIETLEKRRSGLSGAGRSAVAERILHFLQALDRWRRMVPGDSALLVDGGVRQLETARVPDWPGQRINEDAIDLEEFFAGIVKTVLSHSDKTIDPKKKNRDLQSVLRELAAKAGLQLLEPAPGDPVDPDLHHVIDSVRGNGRNQKTIERVLSRGLTRSGQAVEKAEVVNRF